MKLIIVIFFYGCLSTVKLQVAKNANDYNFRPEPVMKDILIEKTEPVQTYHTFEGNVYKPSRINAKPCPKYHSLQDINPQVIKLNKFEQPRNNQLLTPSRRSLILDSFKKTNDVIDLSNLNAQISKDEGSTAIQIKTQKDGDSNTLRSQTRIFDEQTILRPNPYLFRDESNEDKGLNTIRKMTQIVNDEISSGLQSQLQNWKNERLSNTGNMKNEKTDTIVMHPKFLNDDLFDTSRATTIVLQENGSNTLRKEPQSLDESRYKTRILRDGGSNSVEMQLSAFKKEPLNAFLTKKDLNSMRSRPEVTKNLQNVGYDNNIAPISENVFASISRENIRIPIADSILPFKGEQVESLNLKGNANHIVRHMLPSESKILAAQTNAYCSDDKYETFLEPPTRRNFLEQTSNNEAKKSNLKGKEENISDNQDITNAFENINLLHHMDSVIRNDSRRNTKAIVNNHNANEYKNVHTVESPTKENFSSKAKRTSKAQLFLEADRNELKDPTKGQAISNIRDSRLLLMDYDRVCYACTTANNPTCFAPDRHTEVKYCRRGDHACVTKTFRSGSELTIIRDCAISCEDSEVPGLSPKYKTCEICYKDLCNGAYPTKVHCIMLTLTSIVMIVLVKPLL